MIDLEPELHRWFASEKVQRRLAELLRDVFRAELRKVFDGELLDVDAAAELLRMTPAAVRKAVERKQIPCVRVGRRLRFSRAEILRLAGGEKQD